MNWATERAREVVNSVGFREDPEAAIAAALQAVADECEEIAKRARLTNNRRSKKCSFDEVNSYSHGIIGCLEIEEAIRARFPKEEA